MVTTITPKQPGSAAIDELWNEEKRLYYGFGYPIKPSLKLLGELGIEIADPWLDLHLLFMEARDPPIIGCATKTEHEEELKKASAYIESCECCGCTCMN
jgi:hypothetical protein